MLPSFDDVDSLKTVIFRETICEIQISINEKCVGDHFFWQGTIRKGSLMCFIL